MAAVNFPSAPTIGQEFTANGKTWVWSGSKWVAQIPPVLSVAGRTGDIVLTSTDVGLGNVNNTADASKSVASAATLTTPRTINGVSFNGSSNITIVDSTRLPLAGGTMSGAITFSAGQTWPTFNQSTTGNAATATALATARTINGVSFNGTANITLPTVNTSGNQSVTGNKTFSGVTGIGADWTIEQDGTSILFKQGGVNRMRLSATGDLVVTGNVTAIGTV